MNNMGQQQVIDQPLGWLKQIPGNLFSLDAKPLLGSPPPFSWENFTSQLKSLLNADDLSIQPGDWQWRSKEDLFTGLGELIRGFSIGLVPLTGNVWWGMPERELSKLIHLLIHEIPSNTQIDTDFIKTFYRFLAVEVLNTFETVNNDKRLSTTLSSEEGLPSNDCLCLDITITIQQTSLHGRLFLSPEFRAAWTKHYQDPLNHINSPIAAGLEVTVHLEAARLYLTRSEWEQVSPGDFIILNKCSIDPEEKKGRVLLVIEGVPFFRAKLKQGNLKILEHPLHYEVDADMARNPDEHTEEDVDLGDDFNFDEEEAEFDEKNDAQTTKNADLSTASDKDTHEDTEHNFIEETEDNIEEEGIETSTEISEPSTVVKLEDIPLPIVVEVGRLNMSIKKLLELQPGNMLDLNISTDSGVDLVVHGKKIAHGELLRIGESLGIRVLEIS